MAGRYQRQKEAVLGKNARACCVCYQLIWWNGFVSVPLPTGHVALPWAFSDTNRKLNFLFCFFKLLKGIFFFQTLNSNV